jgi:O-antigen/teichoic acid export membrane protein
MDKEGNEMLSKIFQTTAIVFAGGIISKALMYLYRIITARALGPEHYGILNLTLTIFWISVNLSNAGANQGIQRKISEAIGKDQEEKVEKFFWSSVDFTLTAAIGIAGIIFLGSDIIANLIFNKPVLTTYIKIFSLAIPLQVLYTDLASYSKAHKNLIYPMLVDKIYRSGLTLGLTALAIYLGLGLNSLMLIQVFAIATSSLIMAYLAQSKVRPFLRRFSTSRKQERKELIKYSWPLFFSGLIGITMGRIDNIFLGIFDTSETLGVYTAAFPTAQTLMVIGGSLSGILFPTVSEYYAKGMKERSIEITSIALKWIIAASLPALALMVIFARPILTLLFGTAYSSGGTALAILGTAYFIQTTTVYAGSFINSEDRTQIMLYNSLAVAIINIGLNLLLIPRYSATGASAATAFAITIGSLIAVVESYYFFDVQPYRLKDITPAIVSTAVAGILSYGALRSIFDVIPRLALIPGLALFGSIYAITFFLTGGVSDEDIEVLKEIDKDRDIDLETGRKWLKKILEFRDNLWKRL